MRTTGRRRRRVSRILTTALVMAGLLAVIGYGGWIGVRHWEGHVAADEATAVAETYLLKLTNLDIDQVDGNFDDVAAGATGEFKDMHTRSRAKLRQQVIDNNVRSRGHIVESVVKSATPQSVVVVLLVNQSVVNRDNPDPVVDRSRIRMTMDKVDGRWLVRRMELL